MSDSPTDPPLETPSTPPQQLPKESEEPDIQNPNPTSESEDPSQNPQPATPETENPPPENPIDDQIQPDEEPHVMVEDQEQQQDEPEPDPEGTNITLSPPHHPPMSSDNTAQEIKGNENNNNNNNNNNPPAASVRRTLKRKKGPKNYASKLAFERKMQQLSQGLKPIPFVPVKSLDLSRYEELLKKLGLWDFAHLEFDKNIRVDLIGKLIVNYNPKNRGSYVDGFKIPVSRADLGRALKLPKKPDCDLDNFPQEFLSFLEEFVSSWMILHGDEDLWYMPTEIAGWIKLIREGNPQKVDWAGLIWFMVDKELAQRTCLKNCYYASHLQLLIKVQKEELFMETSELEVDDPKMEVEILKEAVAVEDDEDGADVKLMDFEVSGSTRQKLEEQNIELKLGQDCVAPVDDDDDDNVGDADKMEDCVAPLETVGDAVNMEESNEGHADEMEKVEDVDRAEEDAVGIFGDVDEGNKVENIEGSEHVDNAENLREENKDVDMINFGDDMGEEQGQEQWFLNNKIGGQHFLQRCSMAGAKVSEDKGYEDIAEDVEEDGHVEGFKIMPKSPLDGLTSANLMQAFEAGQLPYSTTELGSQSSLELMSSRADNNLMMGGPSMYNNAGKREIDHEHDISHHGLNHKRVRIEGNWDNKSPGFDMCMEQIQHWMEKAKMCHVAAANEGYQLVQHMYEQQLAEKNNEIMQLNYKIGDLQRRKQAEIDRRDRELYLMSSVIDGYRRALKQTQKTFADYRKRCQVPDEPIYKDAGPGGVVKSVMELERERLKQEEENKLMCRIIKETFRRTLNDYEVKWDNEVLAMVDSLDSRLMDAAKDMGLLKDRLMKHKTSASAQNEPQGPSGNFVR